MTGDVQRLPVASLRRDGGTQVRAEVSAATVDNYREAMAEGAAFPPVVAFFDGVDHWLADGFHRVMAAESAGLADVLTEVREGTRRDALRYALGANRKHGLPMSGPDKRRAIGLLLADDEWRGMSDRAIAAEIGASDKTVASVRREMVEATAENPQLDTPRTGRDGKVRRQRTAPAPAVEPVQVEPAVEPAAPAPQEQPEAPAVEPAVEPDAAVQPAHETANDAAPVEPEAAKVSTQNGSESAEVESLRARLIEAERALAEARAEATSLRGAHVEPEAAKVEPDDGRTMSKRKRAGLLRARIAADLRTLLKHEALGAAVSLIAYHNDGKGDEGRIIKAMLDARSAVLANNAAPTAEPAEVERLRAEMGLLRLENEKMRTEIEHMRARDEIVRSWVAQVIAPPVPTSALNLERVAKLVALTSNPNENEARNAAMLACKAIREHQLRIVTKEAAGSQGSELEQAMREWLKDFDRRMDEQEERVRKMMEALEAEDRGMRDLTEQLRRQAADSPRARRAR